MVLGSLIRSLVCKMAGECSPDSYALKTLLQLCVDIEAQRHTMLQAHELFQSALTRYGRRLSLTDFDKYFLTSNDFSRLEGIQASPNILQCLNALNRYKSDSLKLSGTINLLVAEKNRVIDVKLETLSPVISGDIYVLYCLSLLCLLNKISNFTLELDSISFPNSLRNTSYLILPKSIYGSALTFDKTSIKFSISKKCALVPSVFSQPSVFHRWCDSMHLQEAITQSRSNIVEQVMSIIQSCERPAQLKLDDIATRLNKSASHLRRLINKEHTSYRILLNRFIANESAKRLLSGNPIDVVAYELGYSERRAFERFLFQFTGVKAIDYKRAGRYFRNASRSAFSGDTLFCPERMRRLTYSVFSYFTNPRSTNTIEDYLKRQNIIQACEETLVTLQKNKHCPWLSLVRHSLIKLVDELSTLVDQNRRGQDGTSLHTIFDVNISFILTLIWLMDHPGKNDDVLSNLLCQSESWPEFCSKLKHHCHIGFYELSALKLALCGLPAPCVKRMAALENNIQYAIPDDLIAYQNNIFLSTSTTITSSQRPEEKRLERA